MTIQINVVKRVVKIEVGSNTRLAEKAPLVPQADALLSLGSAIRRYLLGFFRYLALDEAAAAPSTIADHGVIYLPSAKRPPRMLSSDGSTRSFTMSRNIPINDDTAVAVDLGESVFVGSGLLAVNNIGMGQVGASFAFRAATNNASVGALGNIGGVIQTLDNVVLTGTTGADTKISISTANSTPGVIYIENRTGVMRTVNLALSF